MFRPSDFLFGAESSTQEGRDADMDSISAEPGMMSFLGWWDYKVALEIRRLNGD